MRADRLLSILLTLQGEGKVKAGELARRLEVSRRTIYRDLDALTAAGVPVYAEPGPTGGVALLDGYRTQLTGLNRGELQTLFFGKPAALLQDLGLSGTADAALLKLHASLPAPAKAGATSARGFLYIDEVNLLEDHLVDLLIDVAASGENVVEREGLSVRHHARFVLVGSGNPEEGELRPQLLDRFGLSVDVRTPDDIAARVSIVRRRDAYERDPSGFAATWRAADEALRGRVETARAGLPEVDVPDAVLEQAARLCVALGTDGLRAELTLLRAARALACLDGDAEVAERHLRRVAPSALRHRLRRDPLDEAGSTVRVARAIEDLFGA